MTNTTTDAHERAYENYTEKVANGTTLHYMAESVRSADQMGYYPMVSAIAYGKVLVALGNAARMGDFYAAAVSKAVSRVSPFFNDYQIMENVARAFEQVVKDGWFDYATMASPEPGRHSDNQHDTTANQAAMLNLIMAEVGFNLNLGTLPGVGWAMQRLINESSLVIYSTYLPRVAENLK